MNNLTDRGTGTSAPELSVVVPTLDEAENVDALLGRLVRTLEGVDWEVIVVDDDSRDGTADRVLAFAAADPRVRCLRRMGARGLAGACLDGIALARGRYVAVMDADLQHDETLLPAMLRRLRAGDVDLVVGSRYMDGGSVGEWGRARCALSRGANALARGLLGVRLTDPMSGFFMVRSAVARECAPRLSRHGFKLLLDLVASAGRGGLRVAELPYGFACRVCGQSKLGPSVGLSFVGLLWRQAWRRGAGSRLLPFALVGSSGVLVQTMVTLGLQASASLAFPVAQAMAVFMATSWNFTLNNVATFGDRRLHGAALVVGLARFQAACLAGGIANLVVAVGMQQAGHDAATASVAGALAGVGWNFVASRAWVWPSRSAAAAEVEQ